MSNEFKIHGAITKEPELTLTVKSSVCKFILPIECEEKGRSAFWLQISAWGKLAEEVMRLPVGTEVVAYGELRANRWTSDNGVEHSSLKMLARRVQLWKGLGEEGVYLKTGKSELEHPGGVKPDEAAVVPEVVVAAPEPVKEKSELADASRPLHGFSIGAHGERIPF